MPGSVLLDGVSVCLRLTNSIKLFRYFVYPPRRRIAWEGALPLLPHAGQAITLFAAPPLEHAP